VTAINRDLIVGSHNPNGCNDGKHNDKIPLISNSLTGTWFTLGQSSLFTTKSV
jgi:hypothetical protein